MATKVFSASFVGLECKIIEVQADIAQGLPAFNIVGLGDVSVQESKERVRSSIKNSGGKFPIARKTINLAPAQIRKQGALFDLPIAISILIEDGQIPLEYFYSTLIVGELSLSGRLRPIKGALAITQQAKDFGFKKIIIPAENAAEASFIKGIKIAAVHSLRELLEFSKYNRDFPKIKPNQISLNLPQGNDFKNIAGLETAKRALAIAAAGGHNVLLEGSPGCGKTIISRAFQDILPPMSEQEILETNKILSIAGQLQPGQNLVSKRPFREAHHTASTVAIIGGGGHQIKPGEITLAHNGVLFLDEIAEFKSATIEALRQPLEDKSITITRLQQSYKFPSNFTLIATMNPCPCGFHGDKKIHCKCNPHQISSYRRKISGPILDRFDIFVRPQRFSLSRAFVDTQEVDEEMENLQESVIAARKIQQERFSESTINQNADMSLGSIKMHALMKSDAQELLDQASTKLHLTNRGYLKTIKIARTIADLSLKKHIQKEHIAEALQYRYPHNKA